MPSRREILLETLSQWHAEGAIDEATFDRLAAKANALDATPLAAPAQDAPGTRSFAAQATQFVGGLLLGAALVAFVVFTDMGEDPSRWALFVLGIAAIAGAIALDRLGSGERPGLVDAAYAAGFVPLGVAAAMGIGNDDFLLAALVAGVGVGVHVLKRGAGPVVMLCAAVVSFASFGATVDLFGGTEAATSFAWLLVLLGYLALTLVWRDEAWSSAAAGGLVIPISIAYIMLVAELLPDVDSLAMEGVIALMLGALFALGLWLGVRGLVAAAAAGLTIDAVVFAFDLGGPGTAVIVLLALGGLLVWQGQGIRAYFKRREHA